MAEEKRKMSCFRTNETVAQYEDAQTKEFHEK
jgi:hypothetical protein